MAVLSIRFVGNKKLWYKAIEKVVVENGYKKVAEPFGGSGVLSVNLKNNDIVEKAIVNDKANFLHRLEYFLDEEEKVYNQVFEILGQTFGNKKLEKEQIEKIKPVFSNKPDEILTYIAEIYVFSASRFGDKIKPEYFKRRPLFEKYHQFLEALQKVELRKLDYKEFIEECENDELLIVDPPYVHSYQNTYGEYTFSFAEYLKLIQILMAKKNDFILFGVEEQGLPEMMELLNNNNNFKISKVGDRTMLKGSRNEQAYLVQFFENGKGKDEKDGKETEAEHGASGQLSS